MLNRGHTITALIDDLSSYFLDHCPDGMYWEDFDPDLNWVRSLLQDFYDVENLMRGGSG